VADDVLRQGVQGISDLITVHGLINLDFADVKTVMKNAGSALMGIGRASGENRAIQAAQQAVESPLLEVSIDGARGILFNVIGGMDMSMHEINTAAETITAAADPDANIIFGATINPELEGEIIITVVATGFDDSYFTNRAKETNKPRTESTQTDGKQDDESMIQNIDMDLHDDVDSSEEFHSDKPMPNIWAMDKDSEGEKDTDKNDESNETKAESEFFADKSTVVGDIGEDELEKPSFLRRLKNRKNKDKDSNTSEN
jgi:cell division protein FtsZ